MKPLSGVENLLLSCSQAQLANSTKKEIRKYYHKYYWIHIVYYFIYNI